MKKTLGAIKNGILAGYRFAVQANTTTRDILSGRSLYRHASKSDDLAAVSERWDRQRQADLYRQNEAKRRFIEALARAEYRL